MFLVIKNGSRVVRREDTGQKARLWANAQLDKPNNKDTRFEIARVSKTIFNDKVITETVNRVEVDA